MAEVTPKKMPRKVRRNYDEPVKDEDLLEQAMKDEIRKKAKEEVLKAKKADAAKLLLEKYKEEELAALEPAKEYVEILIDIPGYSQYMMVDGRSFAQGTKATVTREEARSMTADMDNAWKHETSNGGAHMKDYRAPVLDGAAGAASTLGYRKLMRI